MTGWLASIPRRTKQWNSALQFNTIWCECNILLKSTIWCSVAHCYTTGPHLSYGKVPRKQVHNDQSKHLLLVMSWNCASVLQFTVGRMDAAQKPDFLCAIDAAGMMILLLSKCSDTSNWYSWQMVGCTKAWLPLCTWSCWDDLPTSNLCCPCNHHLLSFHPHIWWTGRFWSI